LQEKIVLHPKETVYVRRNYTSLSKGRSFIITIIYPAIPNTLLDISILYIVIIVNPINKTFTFNKNIYLGSIYKCIDILYIIINITKAFTAVAIAFTAVFKPFTTI